MDQLFTFFSILLMSSVFMTMSSYNPMHSIFWLVMVFMQSSMFMMSLSYEFMGLMLMIIYVGAMAILFLFIIMMLDILQLNSTVNFNNLVPMVFLLVTQVLYFNMIYLNDLNMTKINCWNFTEETQVLIMSKVLYNELGVMFLMVSVLLLIAMMGAMVLTLEMNVTTKKQDLMVQHHSNNSWT